MPGLNSKMAVGPADSLICSKKMVGRSITVTGLHFGSLWHFDREVRQDPCEKPPTARRNRAVSILKRSDETSQR